MIKVSNELMDNWNVLLDEDSIYNAYLSGDRHNSDCFLLSNTYFTDIQLNITNLQLINGVLYADINEVEGLPMNVERVNVEDGHLIAYYREGVGQMSRVDLGIVVGPKGDTGNTPDISVGIVTTGNPGTNASVNISGTKEEPVLNFTIPRGNTGEVSEEELDTAVKSMASPVYDNASGDIVTFDDGAKDALIKSLLATIKPVQSGSGDPSPTNIRPISGRTGLTVTRTGKNLLPKYVISPSVYNNVTFTVNDDGSVSAVGTASATCNAGNVISGIGGEYILSGCPSGGGASTYQLWVFDQTTGAAVGTTDTGNGATVTLDKTHTYNVRIRVQSGYPINKVFYPMLRPATITDDTYEPYTAQTIPITWESIAGTVYGGTLDVVSGVLTVDKGFITYDGSENWNWQDGDTYKRAAVPLTGIYNPGGRVSVQSNAGTFRASGNDVGAIFASGTTLFYYPDASITSLDAYKTWLASNNLQVVYPLATPSAVYNLTPTEIKTLLGGNTIYTDTGAVSVEYVADTGIYIDNSINKVKRLIAGIETTYVASRNYNVGDFIVVNNDLLKVISAIESGETIVIGTNANITTVAEQLILLFNS